MRTRTNSAVVIMANGRRLPTTLLDVSETGARIKAVAGLAVDGRLDLELEDGRTVGAFVVRMADDECGLRFLSPVSGLGLLEAA